MILNQYEVERYIQVTAARADLRVVWEESNQPRTDGKTIYLPHITSKTTQEEANTLMAVVTHEAAHNIYTNFHFMKDMAIDMRTSFLSAIFNQIEDDGVDYLNAMQYYGDRTVRSENIAGMVEVLHEKLSEAAAKGPLPEHLDNLAALLSFEMGYRSDYLPHVGAYEDKFADHLTSKGKEKLKLLKEGDYAEVIRDVLRTDAGMTRTGKAWNLAKRIYEEVFGQDAKAEEERLRQLAKDKASAGEGEGEESDKGEEGKSGAKGAKYGGKKGETRMEDAEVDYREWDRDPMGFIKHVKVGGGLKINYGKSRGDIGTYVPCPLRDTTLVDYVHKVTTDSKYPANVETGEAFKRRYGESYRHLDFSTTDGFAQKVRMLLQIRSKGRTQYGTKQGRLHNANLHRLIVPNSPGYSERVFKKKIVSDTLDTAVQVLIDDSGSMMGNKYSHAMVGAVHLSLTLGNTLHMATELLAFTEQNAKDLMFILRTFDCKLLSKEVLCERMINAAQYAHQNADGDSILFAYSRLIKRKEKRKVMIVLSDGSPAGDRPGDLRGFTKETIRKIEEESPIEIIGIGILDDNVKRLYKDSEVISEPEEIETTLLKLIQRKVV